MVGMSEENLFSCCTEIRSFIEKTFESQTNESSLDDCEADEGPKIKRQKLSCNDPDPTKEQLNVLLPDELLIQICGFIPITSLANFKTRVALERVTKQFRRCTLDANLWKNATELVIGIHPNLSADSYLCHLALVTLKPFLSRSLKITKVMISLEGSWMSPNLHTELLLLVSEFDEKFELQDLSVHEIGHIVEENLVEYLIESSQNTLESFALSPNGNENIKEGDYSILMEPSFEMLQNCPAFKNLQFSTIDYYNDDDDVDDPFSIIDYLGPLKSLETLTISGQASTYCKKLPYYFFKAQLDPRFGSLARLKTLRITDIDDSHGAVFDDIDCLQPVCSLRELEIHSCTMEDNLRELPTLLDSFPNLECLKLTFYPYLKFYKATRKIRKLLDKGRDRENDLSIIISFKHYYADRPAKLAIVHKLLDSFEVSYESTVQDNWNFDKNELHVTLKLEKIINPSLLCHPVPNHAEKIIGVRRIRFRV